MAPVTRQQAAVVQASNVPEDGTPTPTAAGASRLMASTDGVQTDKVSKPKERKTAKTLMANKDAADANFISEDELKNEVAIPRPTNSSRSWAPRPPACGSALSRLWASSLEIGLGSSARCEPQHFPTSSTPPEPRSATDSGAQLGMTHNNPCCVCMEPNAT